MKYTGGCYCGAIRYEANGDTLLKAQCHCRECQYFAGGQSNLTMSVAVDGFSYTQGKPEQFSRTDLENPVTREFCGKCGTPLTTLVPSMPQMVFLKVGSLDQPELYEGAQMVIYTSEKQPFHLLPEGVPQFEKFPG